MSRRPYTANLSAGFYFRREGVPHHVASRCVRARAHRPRRKQMTGSIASRQRTAPRCCAFRGRDSSRNHALLSPCDAANGERPHLMVHCPCCVGGAAKWVCLPCVVAVARRVKRLCAENAPRLRPADHPVVAALNGGVDFAALLLLARAGGRNWLEPTTTRDVRVRRVCSALRTAANLHGPLTPRHSPNARGRCARSASATERSSSARTRGFSSGGAGADA